ncbi:hypothetical protein [Glycomyces artemisiae]|uniref:Tail assembly chaperone n=1 Tax=Glycomyces artemisiae TaxID=1076443 RepID=A0A2T0UER8_9ACTN|nr:hypothetical protein [Glycomyces artemisiae]PRY56436.1 hypothetical protein B0I28_10985 [Glycomyces artemisiae]
MTDDIDEAIRNANLREKTVPVCLNPNAVEAYQEAELAAVKANNDSLRGADPVPQELVDAVNASTVNFTIRALGRTDWRKLVKKHPPREGNPTDRQLGYNEDDFYEALVRKCVIAPAMSAEKWEEVDPLINEGEWLKLVGAVQAVNLQVSRLPF